MGSISDTYRCRAVDQYGTAIGDELIEFQTGTINASGDNTLVGAPVAGLEIRVIALILQNESTTPTTGLIKFGNNAKLRLFCKAEGEGLIRVLQAGREWRVGSGLPLLLNLSASAAWGYSVEYYIRRV